MKRKYGILLFLLAFSAFFAGCTARTVEEMYSLPKRSPEYNNLQSVMDSAMVGMDFAAPVSGGNRQSLQTADLDGDGIEEYIVFTKGASENPLQILILRQSEEDRYSLLEAIPCKGAAFEQVQYAQVDGEPGLEIIVGRRISDQVTKIASVYSFASGQAEQIMSTIYSKYCISDLDQDGCTELMVVRNGEADAGNAVAVLYGYQDGVMSRSLEAPLSEKPDGVRRITVNQLISGEPAVYIASSWGDSAVVTDILALKEGILTNISLSAQSNTSVQTLRNYYVYAEDIDGDGTLELPSLIPMRYTSVMASPNEQNLIRWYCMDMDAEEADKLFTFHNFSGGWYMELDQKWLTRIAAEENGNAYTFYMWNENYGEAMAVFSIYALTGRDRDINAVSQNRFVLYRGENVVYAGKLESASAMYGISEDYLTNCFHLIRQDWKNGET